MENYSSPFISSVVMRIAEENHISMAELGIIYRTGVGGGVIRAGILDYLEKPPL